MSRLDGRVALVTGAARGQGRSHAVRLAEKGADLILGDACRSIDAVSPFYDAPSVEDLEETAELVRKTGRSVVSLQADVRSLGDMRALVDAGLSQLGRLDVVCANAGIFTHGLLWELSEDEWRDMIDVNLTGVWHTLKASVPVLIDQGEGGSIVLTSSTSGLKGYPHIGHYTAAKHGVIGLMRTLANELAPYRIRVNTVCPTNVDTPMVQNAATYRLFAPHVAEPKKEAVTDGFASINAMKVPWVDSRDISSAVAWLVSGEARYVTGVALPVDAGALVL
jgi:SDR family mycofactocin-dependent oxidoreductase